MSEPAKRPTLHLKIPRVAPAPAALPAQPAPTTAKPDPMPATAPASGKERRRLDKAHRKITAAPQAIVTGADVSTDLEPAHRVPLRKTEPFALAKAIVELTRDVPLEPKATRKLRLTLAVMYLAPEQTPGRLAWALRSYAETKPDAAAAAYELRAAIYQSVNWARLARFRAMIASAIDIVDSAPVRNAAPVESATDANIDAPDATIDNTR